MSETSETPREAGPEQGGGASPVNSFAPALSRSDPPWQFALTYAGTGLIVLAVVLAMLQTEEQKVAWIAGTMGAAMLALSVFFRPQPMRGAIARTFHWSTAYGLNNWVLILGVVGIVGLLNAIVVRHSRRWDFTMNQLYTLSDQTIKLLADLKDDVKVFAFYPDVKGNSPEEIQARIQRMKVKEMLEDYQRYSREKLTYKVLDPFKETKWVEEYKLEDWGIVVFETKDKKVRIQRDQLFARSNPFSPQPASFKGEEKFTGALLDLASGRQVTAYFSEGHNEKRWDDSQPSGASFLKDLMQTERYQVKTVNLLTERKVPDDCDVLVVAGPQRGFLAEEVDILRKWIRKPGKGLFLMLEASPLDGLKDLVGEFGFKWTKNLVIETDPRHAFQSLLAPMPNYAPHRITDELKKAKIGTILVHAVYIAKADKHPDGMDVKPILETTAESWAETNLEGETADFDQGRDTKGPLALAYAIEWDVAGKKDEKKEEKDEKPGEKKDGEDASATKSRIVLAGDSDFACNRLVRFVGNKDLFMNTLGWLSFGSERTATIRPKQEETPRLNLTTQQETVIFRSVLFIQPFLVLLLGAIVWHRRRSL